MTLVVTHANGFLGCFTKEADGTMRQRALIDTGDGIMPTPESLAMLADGFDGQFGWSAPALAPMKKGKPKALPPAPTVGKVVDTSKRQRVTRNSKGTTKNPYGLAGHPDDPKPAERPAIILAYLQQTPYQTMREVIEGIGLEANHHRVSRWHHVFSHMVKAKMIAKRNREGGSVRLMEFYAL